MKVLILSITCGNGHNIAASALKESLEKLGASVRICDTYGDFCHGIRNPLNKGYLLSTKYAPSFYGKAYGLMEKRNSLNTDIHFGAFAFPVVIRNLKKYILKNKFDAIVATHIFPAEFLSMLKDKYLSGIKLYGIITDFTIHPFWEETSLDYYVIASSLLTNMAIKKTISHSKILPFGIPVNQKFQKQISKSEARKQLNIKDKYTVFLIAGSMGFGSMAKKVKKLDRLKSDFQMICVCGNNKKLKEHLDNMCTEKDLYVYGYTDKIDVIMDASDCIITKPGGLTVSEALAKELPLILIDPIPGQEDRNKEFLINTGLAISTSSTFGVDEALYHLMNNKLRCEQMKSMAKIIGNPDAGDKLGEFIINEYKNTHTERN